MTLQYAYFGLQARGMPGLLALEVGGVEYEAKAVTFEEWGGMKESGVCPMGYLPMLTLADGTKINEVCAITSTIGHIGKLQGETERDYAICEMLNAKAAEVLTGAVNTFPHLLNEKDWKQEDTQKGQAWVQGELNKMLDQFEKLVKDGKFTSTGKTCGELHLFSTLHQIKEAGASLPSGLTQFYTTLSADEKVKKVLEGTTKMGQTGPFLKPFPK